ncbi:MAG: hypothetical protein AB2809_12680, partial [Candidatus Thiodiazotropha sp.]
VEETLQQIEHGELDYSTQMTVIVERLKSLILGYALAESEERREMLKLFMANCAASDKKLEIELQTPYEQITNRSTVLNCCPFRDEPRIWTGKCASEANCDTYRGELQSRAGTVADVDGVYDILHQYCEDEKKRREQQG